MNRLYLALLALGATGFCAMAIAQRADVLPPARRAPTLEQAAKLLQQPVIPAILPTVANPFAPADFDRVDPVEAPVAAGPVVRARTSRELLQLIAANVNPTGTMIMRGEPILLFGSRGRPLRVGDTLTVAFEGAQYSVEVSGIDRTSFTLRLHNEQISRPIEPGSKQ